MASSKLLIFLLLGFLSCLPFSSSRGLFAEYIGAEFNGVRFTQVPINPNVNFHFILAFAIDYPTQGHPNPTNGHFNPFWDTGNLSPSQVSLIKQKNRNVKVAVSLGGDTVGDPVSVHVNFHANSIESWVNNAVASLTKIIKQYHLDGIDIDYEHFRSTPAVFAECIGRLITTLKKNGVISFASIAPFDDDQVQSHYLALWRKYGHVIDYVNFQFYAYDKLAVPQFLADFNKVSSQYNGGKVLASFGTDNSGGLKPANGFFRACQTLKLQGKLHGIFIWSADDSKKMGFRYEKQAQAMLTG